VEANDLSKSSALKEHVADCFKKRIGILINVEVAALGELPRSEKKTKRVFDYREV
jgi:phenylacetate-CoA ligase